METPTPAPLTFSPAPASAPAARGWFITFWAALIGLLLGTALFFYGLLSFPFGSPNVPGILGTYIVASFFVAAFGKLIHEGLRKNASLAKILTAVGGIIALLLYSYILLLLGSIARRILSA